MEGFKITGEEWTIYHKMSSRYHKILEELNKRFPSTNNIQSALIMLLIHEVYPIIGDIEELQETVKEINEDLYKTDIKARLNSVYGTMHVQESFNRMDPNYLNFARMIKDHCKGKNKCKDCAFYRENKPFSMQCALENNVPVNWDLGEEEKE